MTNEELQTLLQTKEREASRGWRCPDENEIAMYVNAQLPADSKRRFDAHLVRCEACRNLIAFLSTARDWPAAEPVPPNLLVQARDLVVKPAAVWSWRWPIATAAAAMLITAFALFVWRSQSYQNPSRETGTLIAQQRQSEHSAQPIPSPHETPVVSSNRSGAGSKPSTPAKSTVRGKTDTVQPLILFPAEGAVVRRDQLNLRWTHSDDAVFYQVKLVSEDGSLIFQRSDLNETQLRIPDDVRLVSGNKYFLNVAAHTSDGRVRRSGLVGFRISP